MDVLRCWGIVSIHRIRTGVCTVVPVYDLFILRLKYIVIGIWLAAIHTQGVDWQIYRRRWMAAKFFAFGCFSFAYFEVVEGDGNLLGGVRKTHSGYFHFIDILDGFTLFRLINYKRLTHFDHI